MTDKYYIIKALAGMDMIYSSNQDVNLWLNKAKNEYPQEVDEILKRINTWHFENLGIIQDLQKLLKKF